MLSTGGLTDLDNDVLYSKYGGYIEHLPTKERSKIFTMYGVYFIKMLVPTTYRHKPDTTDLQHEGFQ